MMQAGETYFLDTNILLIATDEGRPNHSIARNLFAAAHRQGAHLAVSGQVLREYLVVATRPVSGNGLGLPVNDALENVRAFRQRTVFCEESERAFDQLLDLVKQEAIHGKRIHDANIVATLRAHGLTHLITENTADFQAFDDINLHRLDS